MIYKFASFAKRTAKEDIVKVFSFNAISTLVRMLTGLISVKVVASIIGPCGIALLGQLNNFSTILLGVANGGINSGITTVSYTHLRSPRDLSTSRMPSSA